MEIQAVENEAPKPMSTGTLAAYRTLRLLKLLMERTSEAKTIPVDQIVEELDNPQDGRPPVHISRKSLFASIAALRAAGFEIEYRHAVGYRLITRPLSDEDIVRLHGMVMRSRTMPREDRYDLSCRLIALASPDVRPYLDPPRLGENRPQRAAKIPEVPRIEACELIERAIEGDVPVEFCLEDPARDESDALKRCTMRPLAIKQWNGLSYMLGTVFGSTEDRDTLRSVQIGRMRSLTCRLTDGSLLAADDPEEHENEQPDSISPAKQPAEQIEAQPATHPKGQPGEHPALLPNEEQKDD